MKISPTSFTFTTAERRMLERAHADTGLSKVEIMRRLLQAYVGGTVTFPNLPTLRPDPKATP